MGEGGFMGQTVRAGKVQIKKEFWNGNEESEMKIVGQKQEMQRKRK